MTSLQLQLEGVRRVKVNGPVFNARMRAEALDFVARYGNVSTDDLRRYADRIGIEPHHPNAWGAIFRGKKWRRIGEKKSIWPSNHARRIGVYQLRHG